MDCVSLIHSVRTLEIITKFLLSENQRLMTLFSDNSLLDTEIKQPQKDSTNTIIENIPTIFSKEPADEILFERMNDFTDLD
jgi:hypothetical protein